MSAPGTQLHLTQAASALVLAVLLLVFWRQYRRRYLLDWAASWVALAVAEAVGFAVPGMGRLAQATAAGAGYAQATLLFLGARELSGHGEVPTWSASAWALGLAAAGAAWAFLQPSGPSGVLDPRMFHWLLMAAAFLACAWAIWGGRREAPVGARLVSAVFVLCALEQLAYLALAAAAGGGWQAFAEISGPLAAAGHLLQSVLGLGMVVSLLEEEQGRVGATARLLEASNADLEHEVAERRRAEERARGQETRFRLLAEATSEGILLHREGRLVEINPAVTRLAGWTPEEILGHPILDLVHPADRPTVRARLQQPSDEPLEVRVLHKDGGVMEVELVGRTVEEEGRATRITAVRDLTRRRRAERELRRQALIFESLHDAVVLLDPAGHVLDWNAAATRLFGYEERETAGLLATVLYRKEDAPRLQEMLAAALRDGRWTGTGPYRHQDGSTLVCEAVAIRLPGEAGGEPACALVLSDVTERARLEAQFRQAQKMEAVGRLAGGVAHDFNNLLTVISGYSDLLLIRPDLDETIRRPLEAIHEAAQRAASVTGQLLAFSRKQVLVYKVVDASTLVGNVEGLLRRMIGEDIQLVTVRGPGLGKVRTDPAQLEQVLMNLAVNARDAMPQGGTLTIETANVDLDEDSVAGFPGARVGPHVRLSVTDTGTGMTPEVQAHIFEPFFTTKEAGKGTGLGLATVYGIVKQSDGFLIVESAPGHGTTVHVYLPRHGDEAEAAPTCPPVEVPAGRETVLLVEDDDMLRDLARTILRGGGYTVLEARHAGEALVIAEQHEGPIDLLLTDVVMPHMSGAELARRLIATRPLSRVLFMSGYTDDAVLRHGIQEAEVAFLQKPFTVDALCRMVRETIDGTGEAWTGSGA